MCLRLQRSNWNNKIQRYSPLHTEWMHGENERAEAVDPILMSRTQRNNTNRKKRRNES